MWGEKIYWSLATAEPRLAPPLLASPPPSPTSACRRPNPYKERGDKIIFYDASTMEGDYGLNNMLSSFDVKDVDAANVSVARYSDHQCQIDHVSSFPRKYGPGSQSRKEW